MSDSGNKCITLHQPWASLLVHGVKRIEGRSWPCPMRGRLWIHAASKVPEAATIEAMEEFYREVYAVDGVTDIVFPQHYPVSVLLGCVNVVGCLTMEELVSWEQLSSGVRLEGQTEFCWLCEDPQKLVVPLDMRGRQGVYNLQKKTSEVAPRALRPVQGPCPVMFPRMDPSDPFSLKPGSLQRVLHGLPKPSVMPASRKLAASIAGAKVAALQFRKQEDLVNRQQSPGSSTSSSDPYSSPASATSVQFGQNNFSNSHDDRSERDNDSDEVESDFTRGPGRNAGSLQRKAPRQIAASRIFTQAMGAMNTNGLAKDGRFA